MMTMAQFKILKNVKEGTHLKLTPIPKLPNMDRDVVVNYIGECCDEPAIIYGMSETCDGYAIPCSWIKDFEIVGED